MDELQSVKEMMKTVRSSDSNDKKKQNILKICLYALDALHRGENPTTKEIAEKFDTNIRNVQNHMKKLEFLGLERFGKERRFRLKNALSHKKTTLSETEREFVRSSLCQLEQIDEDFSQLAKIVSEKIMVKDVQTPYYIKPESFEPMIGRKNLVKMLENSITNSLKIEIEYEGKGITLFPYKITAFEGIWYLLADGIEDNSIKNYMLSRMSSEHCYVTGEKFTPEENLICHIEDMESAFSIAGKETEVVVKVKAHIADYFKYKRYLNSQDILEEDTEGNLLISFDITHDEDVDNLIKSWLPDIEVISPKPFRDRIRRELNAYLQSY